MEILALLPIVWLLVYMMSGKEAAKKKDNPYENRSPEEIYPHDPDAQKRYKDWLFRKEMGINNDYDLWLYNHRKE